MDQNLITNFRQQSAEAAIEARIATAANRAKAQGKDFFADIIPSLRNAGVAQTEINKLTAALADSTDKNLALAGFMSTCKEIARHIMPLL